MDQEPVSLKLTTNRLLVFRCDRLAFRYEPVGSSVTLQAWIITNNKN